MYAEKLVLKANQHGVLQGLPVVAPHQEVEVILLIADCSEPLPVKRRQPSPRLANQGARLQGDDIQPAIALEDWNV
ncbi:hypothetical protein CKO12_09705 [Chromatium okenii]|uniref:hypothetical protein n=1 Tax=Chromatium okenii TaxID=61644 RepID=UPI001906C681|nr:hypothetical protein [Chromatium okenii]MBK1642146.1 hypothetical protein [Chromatium okenii]